MNDNALPRFTPRRMKAADAARYVGESLTKFKAGVRSKKWPEGTRDGGNVFWFIEDLDAALDKMKGARSDAWGKFLHGAA